MVEGALSGSGFPDVCGVWIWHVTEGGSSTIPASARQEGFRAMIQSVQGTMVGRGLYQPISVSLDFSS